MRYGKGVLASLLASVAGIFSPSNTDLPNRKTAGTRTRSNVPKDPPAAWRGRRAHRERERTRRRNQIISGTLKEENGLHRSGT